MLWLDSIDKAGVNLSYLCVPKNELYSYMTCTFVVYDDISDTYETYSLRQVIEIERISGIIYRNGVIEFRAYNQLDRKICTMLEFDKLISKGLDYDLFQSTYGERFLVCANDSKDAYNFCNIARNDKIYVATVPQILRFASVNGANTNTITRDEFYDNICIGAMYSPDRVNYAIIYYKYKVLDKDLLTLLAKYKLSCLGR